MCWCGWHEIPHDLSTNVIIVFAVPVLVVVKEVVPKAPVDMVGVASVLSVNVAAPVEVVGFTVTVSTAGCQIPRLLRFRVLT